MEGEDLFYYEFECSFKAQNKCTALPIRERTVTDYRGTVSIVRRGNSWYSACEL